MKLTNTLIEFVFVVLALPPAATAQTQTALKVGERVSGQTKQCVYQALGNEYTQTIRVGEICPPRITVYLTTTETNPTSIPELTVPVETTATAFKTGEMTTGASKQCYYAALGQAFTREIGSTEACPDSITVSVDSGCGRTGLETCARTDTSSTSPP
jgi:hypothetical protein